MAAKFYFYPQPNGNQLITIDLNEDLAELYSDWEYQTSSGQTMNGKIRTSTMLNREIITIIRDRMQGGEDLGHKFAAMQSHLDRGGTVAFTADDSVGTWIYPIKTPPTGGATTIEVFGNPFAGMGLTRTPTTNEYAVIESSPPGAIYEIVKIQSIDASFSTTGGGTITINDPVNFTYPSSCYIRFYRTWMTLKRRERDFGKNIVTNEHGITWSLDVTLTPDYDNLFSFHPAITEDYDPADSSDIFTVETIPEGADYENPRTTLEGNTNYSSWDGGGDTANANPSTYSNYKAW